MDHYVFPTSLMAVRTALAFWDSSGFGITQLPCPKKPLYPRHKPTVGPWHDLLVESLSFSPRVKPTVSMCQVSWKMECFSWQAHGLTHASMTTLEPQGDVPKSSLWWFHNLDLIQKSLGKSLNRGCVDWVGLWAWLWRIVLIMVGGGKTCPLWATPFLSRLIRAERG